MGGEDVGCFPERGVGGAGEVSVFDGEPGLDDAAVDYPAVALLPRDVGDELGEEFFRVLPA